MQACARRKIFTVCNNKTNLLRGRLCVIIVRPMSIVFAPSLTMIQSSGKSLQIYNVKKEHEKGLKLKSKISLLVNRKFQTSVHIPCCNCCKISATQTLFSRTWFRGMFRGGQLSVAKMTSEWQKFWGHCSDKYHGYPSISLSIEMELVGG